MIIRFIDKARFKRIFADVAQLKTYSWRNHYDGEHTFKPYEKYKGDGSST